MRRGSDLTLLALLCAVCLFAPAHAQDRHPLDTPDSTQPESSQRQRLILKDGSYQIVLSYKVVGSVVQYRSAERSGEQEELPLALVDLPATERWKREHSPNTQNPDAQNLPPVLSPDLAKEEATRAAATPTIAPDLRLPEEDSVLALDNFQGTPELVPLPQQASDLNKETAHAVQKLAINPASSAHRIADLRSSKADIQLHVPDPVFYVRIGSNDAAIETGSAITVDTHGASSAGRDTPGAGSPNSGYVIERVDVRYDSRVVDSFRITQLGVSPQPDVIEMKSDPLPGGQWLKLTPATPLEFGEYALVEVLSSHELNLDVWDFGVHPTSPENVEAQRPEPHHVPALNHRP